MIKKTYELQTIACFALMLITLFCLHDDIITIVEGSVQFALALAGFIHGGIKLILDGMTTGQASILIGLARQVANSNHPEA